MLCRRGPFFLLTLLLLCGLSGCASHPVAATSQQALAVPRPPVDPHAMLTLDQIAPAPVLAKSASPIPTTNPAADRAPIGALALYAQARDAEDSGRPYEAIDYLDRAAKVDPTSFDLQRELAHVYLALNSTADSRQHAIDALEAASRLKPDDLETQTDLGRVYLERGDLDSAIEHLRLALQTTEYHQDDDSCAITDYYLAQALQKRGYDRAALDQYTRLLDRLQHAPQSLRTTAELDYWLRRPELLYAEVGRLYEEQGDDEQALEAYQQVAQRNPDDLDTQAKIVRLLVESGRRKEAVSTAVDAVVKTHASAASVAMLHDSYRGDPSAAIDAVRRLYADHPRDHALLFALADLLWEDGQSQQAEQTLRTVALSTTDPAGVGDLRVLRKLFEELLSESKTQEAARLLVEASARQPDTADELLPFWSTLTASTQRGRIQNAQLAAMAVEPAAEAARSYWIARLAVNRPQLLDSALKDAMSREPILRPAYRFALERIESDDSLQSADRQQRVDALVAQARSHADEAFAQELLGTALLMNGNKARAGGDNNAADEMGDSARAAFAQAQKLGDSSPDLQLRIADAAQLVSDDATFERTLWKLISDRPEVDEAYTRLFRYYQDHNQAERSVAVSQSWLAADPDNTAARLLHITLLWRAGVTDDAEKMLTELYKEHPDDAEVLQSLRVVLTQDHGSSDRYVATIEERFTQHPDDLTAAEELVNAYTRQSHDADALRVIARARDAVKDDVNLLYFTAHLYDSVGAANAHRDETIAVLETALKIDPGAAGPNNDLGYLFADEGVNLERAETLIRRAVRAEPDNTAYLDSLGWVLYKLGRFAEARTDLEQAAAPQSQADPIVLNHLGDDLYRLNASKDAGAVWQTAARRADEQAQQRVADDAPPDNELESLRKDLAEKLTALQQGAPAHVAPVGEAGEKQSSRQASNEN
jgi:tetratricopeptide (TPR) repeat protein